MARFIKKILLFLLLVVIANALLHGLAPYYWGNEGFASKLMHYRSQKGKYNTVFFGSSRTHRQVNTGLFDRNMKKVGLKTSTINMGAQATFNPQVYFLYENFLEEDAGKIETVFIELMEVDEIPPQILHTTRNKYWINLPYYWFALRHFFIVREWDEMWHYTVTFFEDFFNANQVVKIIESLNGVEANQKYLGPDRDGYLSIDDEIRLYPESLEAKDLKTRHERFLGQSKNLENRQSDMLEAFEVGRDYPYVSQPHLNKLKELIRKSEERGIRLIYFIADTKANKRLIATWLNLPEANRMELVSPQGSPYNYDSDNRWDLGHLNAAGADVFTRQLAQKYSLLRDK